MAAKEDLMKRVFSMESHGGVIRIHGDASVITPFLRFDERVSVESAQQDHDTAKQKALMDIFVVTPQQTGLQAQLELTKAAIQNPAETTVLFVSQPEATPLTDEQQAEMKVLKDFVADGGAPVFDSPEDAAQHVTSVVSARIN